MSDADIYEHIVDYKYNKGINIKKLKKVVNYIKQTEKNAKQEAKKYRTLYKKRPWIPKSESSEFMNGYQRFTTVKDKIYASYTCYFPTLYGSVQENSYYNWKPLPRGIDECKDLIEKYVDAREIIPFMRASIEEADTICIINKSNISTSEGTKEFLKCLQRYDSNHSPSIWRCFELALNEADYDFVQKRIEGKIDSQQEKRHEKEKKKIQRKRDLIYRSVNVFDICPDLVSKKVISHARYEIIQSEEQQRGKCHATYPLLDSIWRLHVNWFAIFLRVLRKHRYDCIADEILKAAENGVKFKDPIHTYDTNVYDIPSPRSGTYDFCEPRLPHFQSDDNGTEKRNQKKTKASVSSHYYSIANIRQFDGYTIYTPS